jgi:hypothetical protein
LDLPFERFDFARVLLAFVFELAEDPREDRAEVDFR